MPPALLKFVTKEGGGLHGSAPFIFLFTSHLTHSVTTPLRSFHSIADLVSPHSHR